MWRYHLPTEVFFGEKAIDAGKEVMSRLGKRTIVTTGKSSKKNGSLEDLEKVLEELNIEYEVFDGVKENPSFDILREARERFKDHDVDFVIGLGGGSPMDFAKALSVLLKNPHLRVPELYDTQKYSEMYPVIAIPTTAGTGSEVTQYSVITDDEGNKRGFGTPFTFPTISFVDPRYTLTMPRGITMSTGIDALCHAIEGMISRRANPLSDILASEAIYLIKENLPRAMDEPENYEYREGMSRAAMLAGMVIAQTGTTINHALGYPLSSFKGIRHGQATGLFLVETLKVVSKEVPDRVEEALKAFGGLEGLEGFLRDLGVYDARVDVSDTEIERWSERASRAKHLAVTPGDFDVETIGRIYEEVLKKIS